MNWSIKNCDIASDAGLLVNHCATSLQRRSWSGFSSAPPQWQRDSLFRVDGLDEIVWWLLPWTGFAEVIRPLKLRQRLVEQLEEGLRMNHLAIPEPGKDESIK